VGFLNIPLPGYLGEKILDYPGSQKSSNLETLAASLGFGLHNVACEAFFIPWPGNIFLLNAARFVYSFEFEIPLRTIYFYKALRKTFFSEIFVFVSFGNCLFTNFGNISVMSEPSELIPTQKITKIREKSHFFVFFVFASFGK